MPLCISWKQKVHKAEAERNMENTLIKQVMKIVLWYYIMSIKTSCKCYFSPLP